MRDVHVDVRQLVRVVESTDLDTADRDICQRVSTNTLSNLVPPSYVAPRRVRRRVARHGSAHGWYAERVGWNVARLTLRPDATEECVVDVTDDSYITGVRRAIFLLVGLASDLREPGYRIHECYDTLACRLRLNALNERAMGPPVLLHEVAEEAVLFVAENLRSIENIALALYHSNELIHEDVKLFGRCAR